VRGKLANETLTVVQVNYTVHKQLFKVTSLPPYIIWKGEFGIYY